MTTPRTRVLAAIGEIQNSMIEYEEPLFEAQPWRAEAFRRTILIANALCYSHFLPEHIQGALGQALAVVKGAPAAPTPSQSGRDEDGEAAAEWTHWTYDHDMDPIQGSPWLQDG